MRLLLGSTLLSCLLLSTLACDRPESADDRRTRQEKVDQAAHKAGENLYKAAEKTKEVTQEAVERVKKTGDEVKDGWQDAKHSDPKSDPPQTKQ